MLEMPNSPRKEAPAGTAALSPPWWVDGGDRENKGGKLGEGVSLRISCGTSGGKNHGKIGDTGMQAHQVTLNE